MTAPTLPLQEARTELEQLAYRANSFPSLAVQEDLIELSTLPLREAELRFDDLCTAIRARDGIEAGCLHWSEILPAATGVDLHGQAVDAAEQRVTDLLDVLVGDAR